MIEVGRSAHQGIREDVLLKYHTQQIIKKLKLTGGPIALPSVNEDILVL